MTSNKGLLSQLQEIPYLHPHFLVNQPWVSSMEMCVLKATIVLEGVQSPAHVLQVKKKQQETVKKDLGKNKDKIISITLKVL